jgi:hypothetical protein
LIWKEDKDGKNFILVNGYQMIHVFDQTCA